MFQLSVEMRRCDELCLECYRTCLETVAYCLQKGGHYADAGHIRLLLDCADICQARSSFLSRRLGIPWPGLRHVRLHL